MCEGSALQMPPSPLKLGITASLFAAALRYFYVLLGTFVYFYVLLCTFVSFMKSLLFQILINYSNYLEGLCPVWRGDRGPVRRESHGRLPQVLRQPIEVAVAQA